MRRAFSLLGMVPGILVTIGVAATVQYTSLILWRLCLEHPEIRDVCDVARVITGGSELAYRLTVVMFILNNVFIQGQYRNSLFEEYLHPALIFAFSTPLCGRRRTVEYTLRILIMHDHFLGSNCYNLLFG